MNPILFWIDPSLLELITTRSPPMAAPRYWEQREKIGLEMQSLLNDSLEGVGHISGMAGKFWPKIQGAQ